MSTLVVGASGATGKLLVEQLLQKGEQVKAIVRSESSFPESLKKNENVSITYASVLELSDLELSQHVNGCRAVASCLGHNLNFKGLYGQPRRLVTNATHRLCNAIKSNNPEEPVKFVLMSTTGYRNLQLSEKISFGQKFIIWMLRLLLPPHVDNEKAADYLQMHIGNNDKFIEWATVRPDTLINEDNVSDYELHPSPIRSAIFDAGKTSRINVGNFMTRLITEKEVWKKWKGQMPVIYNKN